MTTTRRCADCNRAYAVRQDGNIRHHRDTNGRPCGWTHSGAPLPATDSDDLHSVILDELVSRRLRRAADRCGVSLDQALIDAISNYCTDVETTAKRPRSSAMGGWTVLHSATTA